MEILKNFELDFQKYLRLRKVLRSIELVCLAGLLIVFLYSGFDKVAEIFGCVAAVLIVPELYLTVYRCGLKDTIKKYKLLAEKHIKFYSGMKTEFEKMKNEIISLGKDKSDTEELNQLIQKEKKGTGWLSTKIKEFEKECNEAKQAIKSLESIKKRLVIF
jgi:septal ring factor EnvC (AmiA/AmiB activator)